MDLFDRIQWSRYGMKCIVGDDRLLGFGMITGSLEVASIFTLKDHSCKMTKTIEFPHYKLIIILPLQLEQLI